MNFVRLRPGYVLLHGIPEGSLVTLCGRKLTLAAYVRREPPRSGRELCAQCRNTRAMLDYRAGIVEQVA